MGLLHVGSIGALATVVGLDGEGVLLLQFAVQLVLGTDDSLACGLVQHHCLEGDILSMDPEATDLSWVRQKMESKGGRETNVVVIPGGGGEEGWRGRDGSGGSKGRGG